MPSDSKKTELRTLEPKSTLRYRILRYTPDLVRDEWVNIGVLLEETRGSRHALRLIEEPREIARIRRLHPDADEDLLRALPVEFEARLRGPDREVSTYLEKLEQNLSNALQFSPQKALLAENFDDELDRLYRDHVAPPSRRAEGILQSTRDWMREKLNDVFRRHRVLGKLEQRVRIEGFTPPGDPLRLDYGYQDGCAVSFIRFLCGATSRRPRCWPTPPSAFTPAIPGRRSRPSPRSSPRPTIHGINLSRSFLPSRTSGS